MGPARQLTDSKGENARVRSARPSIALRLLASPRARSAALFVLALGLWAAILPRMRVDMSIAHFLPESQDPRAAGLLRALAESELASVTIVHLFQTGAAASGPDARARRRARTPRSSK